MGRSALVALVAVAVASPRIARVEAQESSPTTLTALGKDIYLARGAVGNTVVAVTSEGTVVVGVQDAASRAGLERALATLGARPVRYVFIDAHPALERDRDAGWGRTGAVVIAEEHAAGRMMRGLDSQFPRGDAPSDAPGRPSLGFSEVQQIHAGAEDVHIVRQKPGSTNADVSAHFEAANVIYLGNAFTTDGYPTVDEVHGGDYAGLIETASRFMTWPAATRIVPARGPAVAPVTLLAYHAMLVAVRNRVRELKSAGQSLEAILSAAPTDPYDAQWGKGTGSARALVTAAYHSLK
ncbi:MAG: hypothetical protein H0W68_07270 [Gemmatimonadaceae bacterium]|nr:hypothetical protein [Gemmatimonadaceae bacterium]